MSPGVDLRRLLGAARDQGTRPTCLAFAMSDAHACSQRLHHPLAPDYAHYHAARREGATMNEAVTTTSMRHAIEQDGQPSETICPYGVSCDDHWSPPIGMGPVWKRASKLISETPSSVLLGELIAQRPSVLTLSITEAFYAPDPQTFEVDPTASPVVGYHAVVVVGAREGGTAFLVRNSWGGAWGLEGHAWLVQSYVDARAIDIVQF
jgi:papain like protease